ncbi:MAG: rare lipoprotein [Solirubrobacteraceae bacterium]|nr:rare lipoprotein [Solirubrobacteraceae bacterium]
MLVASPLLVAPPVWAATDPTSGGASVAPLAPGIPSPTASTGTPSAGAANASLLTTATGNGITLSAKVSSLLGHKLGVVGITNAASAGKAIALQRLDPQAGWVTVATGTVVTGGVFWILWRTNHAGPVTLRTVLEQAASTTQTGQASPTLQINIYRPAIATYYGKGFFGRKTACGMILKRATLGVASRSLKCGTPVQIYYGGRSIVVPVIDRGPYANHASWDLTEATAQALGITGTEVVGAMPL